MRPVYIAPRPLPRALDTPEVSHLYWFILILILAEATQVAFRKQMSKALIMQLDCVRNPWKDDVTSASGLGQGSWREMPTWSLRAWTSPCPEPHCPFLKTGNRGTWGEHAERPDSRDPFIQILAYFQRRAARLPPEDGSHHQTASERGGRGGCGKRGQQHVSHARWAPREAGGRGSPVQCNRAASSPTQTTVYTNTYGL